MEMCCLLLICCPPASRLAKAEAHFRGLGLGPSESAIAAKELVTVVDRLLAMTVADIIDEAKQR